MVTSNSIGKSLTETSAGLKTNYGFRGRSLSSRREQLIF